MNTQAISVGQDMQHSGVSTLVISKKVLWTGRILSSLSVLFLLLDGAMKIVKPQPVVEATVKLGYPVTAILPLGVVLLSCVALYAVRRTSVLGAILLTGYLGGAVASHVRVGDPLFSHILFPLYLGCLIWGGLYMRCPSLRALVPLHRQL